MTLCRKYYGFLLYPAAPGFTVMYITGVRYFATARFSFDDEMDGTRKERLPGLASVMVMAILPYTVKRFSFALFPHLV